MSQIYFNHFTAKVGFLCLALFSVIIFSCGDGQASGFQAVTAHYYVATDQAATKYDDKLQWKITNQTEWNNFIVNLKKLPLDSEKNNPMGLKQPDIIHFSQTSTDLKTGNDIFLSKAGIQRFAKIPLDSYWIAGKDFGNFLKNEYNLYPELKTNINVNAKGIVVIYKLSDSIGNPSWVITSPKLVETYEKFIRAASPTVIPRHQNKDEKDGLFDGLDVFTLYLNYPNAPYDFVVVGKDGSMRASRVKMEYSYHKDAIGFYNIFKKQALSNIEANKKLEQKSAEELEKEYREKQPSRGNAF